MAATVRFVFYSSHKGAVGRLHQGRLGIKISINRSTETGRTSQLTKDNDNRLGAIGDLSFGLDQGDIRDDFLVVNGDNLFKSSLDGALDAHRRRGNTIVLYDVGSQTEAAKMGIAACDETGRVIGFHEKPSEPATTVVSIGIDAYREDVRDWVDRYLAEGNSPDKTGCFVGWLHQRTPVYGHAIRAEEGLWFDIGSHEQMAEANLALSPLRR